jgi:hypothetical protein
VNETVQLTEFQSRYREFFLAELAAQEAAGRLQQSRTKLREYFEQLTNQAVRLELTAHTDWSKSEVHYQNQRISAAAYHLERFPGVWEAVVVALVPPGDARDYFVEVIAHKLRWRISLRDIRTIEPA